jgi:hypothetical protein
MPSPIMGDHSEAVMQEEYHLRVPVVTRQRPPMMKNNGLPGSPVFEIDLSAVFYLDRAHILKFLKVIVNKEKIKNFQESDRGILKDACITAESHFLFLLILFKSAVMKRQKLLFFFLIVGSIALTVSSCQKNNGGNGNGKGGGNPVNFDSVVNTGDGITASQVRTPGNFTAVNLTGSGQVNITMGPTLQLTVSDDSNLLALVQTTVSNNTLTVGYKPNTVINGGHLVVTIVMPALIGTSITGSGIITETGNFAMNGAFTTTVTGSGTINLNGGSADSLVANINGSGLIKAQAFPVKDAYVTISGSGEVDVTASDLLNATLSGAGAVLYTGNPTIIKKITGSGQVIKN